MSQTDMEERMHRLETELDQLMIALEHMKIQLSAINRFIKGVFDDGK